MKKHLLNIIKNYSEQYLISKPFPHVVIDNFLPFQLAEKISNNITKEIALKDEGWVIDSNKTNNFERFRLEDTSFMRTELRSFANYVNSREFVLFMEAISGHNNLIVDPYFVGGGAMVTRKGGFLNMHKDFNWHHKLQLWRKINCIIYLTKDWDPNWGGELYLSDSSKYNESTKKVVPFFNRAIIFQTYGNAWHGHPIPLNCPKDKARGIFSTFYYSNKSENENEEIHFTKYENNSNKCDGKELKDSPYCSNLKL